MQQLFQNNATISSSEVLAEIIVCVKELNKAAREEAFKLLTTISERCAIHYEDSSHFIQLVCAGLAGTTPHMISATVMALTRIVHHLRDQLSPEFTESLYQTVLILFTTRNREIVKSCLGFIKTTCTILTDDRLRANMKQTIDNIFLWIDESKNRFRLKIKLILQKFIIKLGYEEIQRLVPQEHHKLLASVRKDIQRKIKDKGKGKSTSSNNKDDEELEDIDSDSDLEMESDDEFIEQFRVELDEEDSDDEDNVVDLLDPNASKRTKNTKQKTTKEDDILKRDKKGRLVIEEEGKGDEEDKPPTKSIHDLAREKGGVIGFTKGKRARVADIDEDDENSNEPPRKRQKVDTTQKYSGKEYRASKSAGDVKVTGKYEPFAYLPMNPQLLNKRKQQKVKKQYKSVISSAQKGATKGKSVRKSKRH